MDHEREEDTRLTRRELVGLGAGALATAALGCGDDDNVVGRGGAGGDFAVGGAGGRSAGGAGGTAGETPVSCELSPQQAEGPFFFDTELERSDITGGQTGVPHRWTLTLVDVDNACARVEGATVELWHANAAGAYSGYSVAEGNPTDETGETYLRGHQTTDAQGRAEFVSVFPGSYPGRTVHVHAKILLGENELITTQLYFDQSVIDTVLALPPYTAGPATTTNATDGVSSGELASLTVASNLEGSGAATTVSSEFVIGVRR